MAARAPWAVMVSVYCAANAAAGFPKISGVRRAHSSSFSSEPESPGVVPLRSKSRGVEDGSPRRAVEAEAFGMESVELLLGN